MKRVFPCVDGCRAPKTRSPTPILRTTSFDGPRCCLEKLEDEDTGKIYFTHISCKLLDAGLCTCKDYPNRSDQVPDCVRLTPENVRTLNWLPPSCGYKLVAEGRDLYWWHPLISGDPNTVHEAGVSVRGRVLGTEDEIADEDLEDHIVQWPALLPKRARLKKRPKALGKTTKE